MLADEFQLYSNMIKYFIQMIVVIAPLNPYKINSNKSYIFYVDCMI